jgi:hypothetical protein
MRLPPPPLIPPAKQGSESKELKRITGITGNFMKTRLI